ncbi:S41 family peptidase [Chitinimonas koreensis]|uniref:S41 family peptidase n=1 Tax=Chitinimonas koreensis TaxID=356302 RepID=UPI000400460B|nr:S41 family peptidase [Chitinimonas koreensis]QNM94846.1 S41 family peptidase [Chitinimonas koreensis]
MPKTLRAALLALATIWPAAAAQADAVPSTPTYSVEQLQQDFRFLQDAIARTHPDPGHSTDAAALERAYRQVEAQLRQPMTRDQAWRVLATLNPVFADGHLAVLQRGWQAQTEAHLAAGGTLFPFEVHLTPAGEVFIRAELGGGASPLAGARIESIGGRPAAEAATAVLARAHGDTPEYRAHLASRRWPFLYWKLYGSPASYPLVVRTADGSRPMQVAAGRAVPAPIQEQASFERNYRLELLPKRAALLTVRSFYQDDKKPFFDFAERAFATLREAKVETLIVDVRDNDGGDDDMWQDGILRYIADKPYRIGSSYLKKVLENRRNERERVGEVVAGSIEREIAPQPGHPLHFAGRTYVLIGRHTYSSAILFANVVQDYGFATVAGAGGYARARQSGGVQSLPLPHTGLVLSAPRFVLDRPAGPTGAALVKPDLLLPDSPFNPRELVDALLARLDTAGG